MERAEQEGGPPTDGEPGALTRGEAIDALREQVAFFDHIWRHSPDSMFIVAADDDGFRLEAINPTLERRSKVEGRQVLGHDLSQVMAPEQYRRFATRFHETLTRRKPLSFEHNSGFGHCDSSRIWRTLLIPVFSNGGARIYALCRDVTSARRIKDVLRRGKKTLERRMAHRVRELQDVNQELHEYATLDGLTRTYNRRYFFELAEREFDLARRHAHPLAVIMLDMDFFKGVNDTYGHATGDRALELVAEAVRHNLRATDIFGRYGGEEFTIVLPDTGIDDARLVAEKIRHTVENSILSTERGPVSCTVSLGVAALRADSSDFMAVLNDADAALLRAKRGGRNRVECV